MARQPARCHPDRLTKAHGLCDDCYYDAYLAKPGTEASALRERRRQLRTQWALPTGPPRRVPNVVQRALVSLPERCPHCHRVAGLIVEGREIHCTGAYGGCGATYYLVRV